MISVAGLDLTGLAAELDLQQRIEMIPWRRGPEQAQQTSLLWVLIIVKADLSVTINSCREMSH